MTQWVEPDAGRPRGALGLIRSWVAVMGSPRRFFASGVSPGDQAPGLIFAMVVSAVAIMTWLAVVATQPPIPVNPPLLGYALTVFAIVGVLTPLGLHLIAALQTLVLLAGAAPSERAGVDETVQVLAYSTAPCVFAGTGNPWITLVATGYGTVLLTFGLAVRHDLSVGRSTILSLPGAGLVFGWAFRGVVAAGMASAQIRAALESVGG